MALREGEGEMFFFFKSETLRNKAQGIGLDPRGMLNVKDIQKTNRQIYL